MRPEDVQKLLKALSLSADKLNRAQVKQIYRLLIAVGKFPICPACHKPITKIEDFTWDHIWPASRGGSNDLCNMQPMHRLCNTVKGDEIQLEYLECSYELTVEVSVGLARKKRKKTKKRNPPRYKPSQGAEMCIRNKRRRNR